MDWLEHSNYTVLFAQRQEELFVDQVRKVIDLEVKMQILQPEYEKTKKELIMANELLKQATHSIEQLTNKNDRLTTRVEHVESDLAKMTEHKINFEGLYETSRLKLIEAEREIQRQSAELQLMFDENNEFKRVAINKKKVVKNDTDVSDTTGDNTF